MTADRISAYLARLGLEAAPPATAEGLTRLQEAHRWSIAFENLDIRLGRPIRIDGESVFDKLVTRGRGGYCFEQNRLFSDMLAALGFPNRPLLARVRLGLAPDDPHPPRTHMLLLVDLRGERWIADAGFGGSYVTPMPLVDGTTVTTGDGASHRLRCIGQPGDLEGEWLLERAGSAAATDGRAAPHTGWQPQYVFDLSPVAQADLDLSNHWTSTRPETRFTMLHMVSVPLPRGFVTLTDHALRITDEGSTSERDIATPADYHALLRERFGLTLSAEEVAALPLFAPSGPGGSALS